MQTLLKILQRYSNFLVFLILEVAAFLLIVYHNAAPRSHVLSSANAFIAWQYEQESEVRGYFSLRQTNEQLAAENAVLRNQIESMKSGEIAPNVHYMPAQVVQMTTDELHNYLTINRGSKDSVVRGQGVRNAEGVVGIVRTVGPHYSVVLPIINTHTHISCRFTKNDYIATLVWDGKDTRYANLTDVAAHMVINAGDTIVTSGLSPVFPEGIPVGIVESSRLQAGDSYHTIRVRLNTDFKRLKHVEVIQNRSKNELEELQYGLD
ncbi:MAG: rod shape-determining protein MreC [Paludibacteraceae bacterium]|nr:rod shape-determining protein MreC [Paludibacteraceae bacterium]